jgi:hypothetical protein
MTTLNPNSEVKRNFYLKLINDSPEITGKAREELIQGLGKETSPEKMGEQYTAALNKGLKTLNENNTNTTRLFEGAAEVTKIIKEGTALAAGALTTALTGGNAVIGAGVEGSMRNAQNVLGTATSVAVGYETKGQALESFQRKLVDDAVSTWTNAISNFGGYHLAPLLSLGQRGLSLIPSSLFANGSAAVAADGGKQGLEIALKEKESYDASSTINSGIEGAIGGVIGTKVGSTNLADWIKACAQTILPAGLGAT